MPETDPLAAIRAHLGRHELGAALQKLQTLLAGSPLLDEALHQAGRFAAIRKQIRLGTVDHQASTLTLNQITHGILELLGEIDTLAESDAAIRRETGSVTYHQHAEKIYNIDRIDRADFS